MPRVLGLDFGTKRIGEALSDSLGKLATPLEVYHRRTDALDARHFRDRVEAEGIERIVIGLPIHTSGREGELAGLAREFADWLRTIVPVPVVMIDERFTTSEAEDSLRSQGLKSKGRRDRRDMIAAAILLQHYLDRGCPDEDDIAAPLDDSP